MRYLLIALLLAGCGPLPIKQQIVLHRHQQDLKECEEEMGRQALALGGKEHHECLRRKGHE